MKERSEEQENMAGALYSAADPLAPREKLQLRGKQFANSIQCFQLRDPERRWSLPTPDQRTGKHTWQGNISYKTTGTS